MRLTHPRLLQLAKEVGDEDGQTMAEYSVVLTLIIITIGIGAFVALAVAVISQYERVTDILNSFSIP